MKITPERLDSRGLKSSFLFFILKSQNSQAFYFSYTFKTIQIIFQIVAVQRTKEPLPEFLFQIPIQPLLIYKIFLKYINKENPFQFSLTNKPISKQNTP